MRLRLIIVVVLASFTVILASCLKDAGREERSLGEVAFKTYCQSCHTLPKPKIKTDTEWPSFVQRYGQRAKLSPEQIDIIASYLIANN